MIKRILTLVIAFPVAILLISLAVANRHGVTLILDPFRPDQPALSVVLPFYAYLFGALLTGIVMGGVATWLSQGRWRRIARVRASDAKRWHQEADRLLRERDAGVQAQGTQRTKAISGPAFNRDAA